jgi:hypothetical protein
MVFLSDTEPKVVLACCVHTHARYFCQDNAQALQVVQKLCTWFINCQTILERHAQLQEQHQQGELAVSCAESLAQGWVGTGEI